MSNSLMLRRKLIDVRSPDVPVPSSLNSRGREPFKNYLDSGPNKTFAVAGDLHFGWATARRTIDEAINATIGRRWLMAV